MKFNYVLLAAAAALAVSAESAEECVKTQNCGEDVTCIAHCFGVPAPTTQQVSNVESCIGTCNGSIDCYSACIANEFLGTGSGAQAAATGANGDAAANGTTGDATATGAANATPGATDANAAGNTINPANATVSANATPDASVSGASSRVAFTGLVGALCSALYFLF